MLWAACLAPVLGPTLGFAVFIGLGVWRVGLTCERVIELCVAFGATLCAVLCVVLGVVLRTAAVFVDFVLRVTVFVCSLR